MKSFLRSGERVYYRPAGPSLGELLFVASLALIVLFLVERRPWADRVTQRDLAVAVTEKTAHAFAILKQERAARGIPELPSLDPAHTGLIFRPATAITTSSGVLAAKQTSINPNFAALILAFYLELGLERGDVIAVGLTGSFPALNVAALVAAEGLGVEPLVIASAAASDYGASDEEFSWLDMAGVLSQRGVLQSRTLAASLGGLEDLGVGLSPAGAEILERAIERSGSERLKASSYDESLSERLTVYDRARAGRLIKAYLNIGGGAVSYGRSRAQGQFDIGINQPRPDVSKESVMGLFLSQGVPVIQLVQIVELATRYGLPVRPRTTPKPGEGALFRPGAPPRWLASGGLLSVVLAIVWIGIRGSRRRQWARRAYNPATDTAPSRHARPPSRGPVPESQSDS